MKEHLKKYEELAKKHGRPIEEIQKICDSQFEFVKETMRKGEDEPIRLQYLGVFQVKPNRRELVEKRRQRMKDYHDKRKQEKR